MSATTNSHKKIKKIIIVGSACHRPNPAASSPDPMAGEGGTRGGGAAGGGLGARRGAVGGGLVRGVN